MLGYPRQEPYAVVPHVRICAGARQVTAVPTATVVTASVQLAICDSSFRDDGYRKNHEATDYLLGNPEHAADGNGVSAGRSALALRGRSSGADFGTGLYSPNVARGGWYRNCRLGDT